MISYRKKHVKNKIHKIKPKKSILKRPWFWILIIALTIILSVAYFLFFYPTFQVENIIISGNKKVKTEELQKLVSDNINTKLINITALKLTTKSILLVNSDKLNKEILEKFPLIEKIKINKNLPQTLILGVIEREPLGVYCTNAEFEQQCFLIDENGIIFEPVVVVPENITIVRQTIENSQIFTGEEVIAQNIMSMISIIKKTLKDNFQIDLEEALVTSPLRLNIKTNENWQIYFSLDSGSDFNSQLIKLKFLLSGEISPEIRKKLQYIDLRFEDRAYYK